MALGTRHLVPRRSATNLALVLLCSGLLPTVGACVDLAPEVSTTETTASTTTTTTSIVPTEVAETSAAEGLPTDPASGSDATVSTAPAESLWTSFGCMDPRLHYDDGWIEILDPRPPARSARAANGPAKVEMEFAGLRIALVSVVSSAMGKAKVTLDGGAPIYVDLYDPARSTKTVWTSDVLDPETHTLEIEWSGLKHPDSLSSAINIYSIEVMGTLL